ncbi:hypothetical protein L6164_024141 [Bauhinia variegata]|uniref:Uncharacterized protein n=1 Tax=Bauhinia variegata TaxID=167791 RepID=A0ACB9LWW6_BAUVA|nr:hypothetical protein L6164_024141 [Bauhinia variegata]
MSPDNDRLSAEKLIGKSVQETWRKTVTATSPSRDFENSIEYIERYLFCLCLESFASSVKRYNDAAKAVGYAFLDTSEEELLGLQHFLHSRGASDFRSRASIQGAESTIRNSKRSSILSEKGEAFDIHKRRTGARRDAAVESGFVRELIMSSINKNYVDMDEYPLTTELQLTKLSAKCGRRFLVTLYLMSLVGKLFHFMVTVENSNGFFLEHMGMAHRGFSLGLRESKA